MNLFYDILPYELQHKILMICLMGDMREKILLRRHKANKKIFEEMFKKSHGRKLPKWTIHNIVFGNNVTLYWRILLDSVNHIQYMNNPILFMKFMKHKLLIKMCLDNDLKIKKNWSKQKLIGILMGI